jgi:hypothetical protein
MAKLNIDLSEAQKDRLSIAIGDINAADSSFLPKEVFRKSFTFTSYYLFITICDEYYMFVLPPVILWLIDCFNALQRINRIRSLCQPKVYISFDCLLVASYDKQAGRVFIFPPGTHMELLFVSFKLLADLGRTRCA